MTKNQLDTALMLGFTTQEELKAFEFGYMKGIADTYEKVTEDIEEVVTIPDYMNDAIAEGVENERRMELKEKNERYADYSDQREGE